MAIEGISESKSVDPYAQVQQALGSSVDEAAVQAQVKEVAPLLANGVSVSFNGQRYDMSISKAGKLKILTEAPELEDAEAIGAEVDLAALVAFLQMDATQSQLEVAKQRIEVTKGRIEADHEATKRKCEETVALAKEAEAKAEKSKLFGIISMIISLALTVVLSAVTMGAGGVVAALLVTGFMIGMQKSGANEAIVKGLADLGQKALTGLATSFADTFGLEFSEEDRENIEKATKIMAGVTLVAAEFVVSLAIMKKVPRNFNKLGRFKFADKLPEGVFRGVKATTKGAMIALGVSSIVIDFSLAAAAAMNMSSQLISADAQYDEAMSEAELKRLESFLSELQNRLQDDDEVAKFLMQLIYSYIDSAAEILASKTDVEVEISQCIA